MDLMILQQFLTLILFILEMTLAMDQIWQ